MERDILCTGELILIRSSRKEVFDDLGAISEFLDHRRAGQKYTSGAIIQQAQINPKEAA